MKKRSRLRQFLDFLIDGFYQLISLRSNTYRWKRRQFDRARQKKNNHVLSHPIPQQLRRSNDIRRKELCGEIRAET